MHRVNTLLLWLMRIGIVAMIIATGVYMSIRDKPSAEQQELIHATSRSTFRRPSITRHRSCRSLILLLRDKSPQPADARKKAGG